MSIGFNELVNDLETRVTVLEQYAGLIAHPLIDFETDPDTDETTAVDSLDWSVSADKWESYSQLTALADTDPGYPGFTSSTPYAAATAHLVSGMCSLSGMVRRKAGSVTYNANTRSGSAMFALPDEWRPVTRVVLPCLIGNTDPTTLTTIGIGMIEIRPESDTELPAGIVYFISGSVSLTAGVGWVALLGSFPCVRQSNEDEPTVTDSWDDVPEGLTWDSIDPGVTWDTYPNSAT